MARRARRRTRGAPARRASRGARAASPTDRVPRPPRRQAPPTSGLPDSGTECRSRAAPGFERQVNLEIVADLEHAKRDGEWHEADVLVREVKSRLGLEMIALDCHGERRGDAMLAACERDAHLRLVLT